MSTYTPEQLTEILHLHAMWLRGEDGGRRAYLSGADLIEADLCEANLRGADLIEADLSGADLSGAFLSGAFLRRTDLNGVDLSEANLNGADLREANLSEADLSGADLSGADLRWADLRRADLRRADLSGAGLSGAIGIVLGPQRSDGHLFWLTHDGTDYRARAGCRDFTFADAREHWTRTRGGTPLGDETLRILDYLEACAPSMILPKQEAAE